LLTAHDSAPSSRRAVDHAAFAISDTRSQVVAFMLGRASIRASHATRFGCGAPSSDHSGVEARRCQFTAGTAGHRADRGRMEDAAFHAAASARAAFSAGILSRK
jgi:hypothetical protein